MEFNDLPQADFDSEREYLYHFPPAPPEIKNVALSQTGGGVEISAVIETHIQKLVDPNMPNSLINDPDLSPNPPEVDAVRFYYYVNGNTNSQNYRAMEYNAATSRWETEIASSEFSSGDTLTYFIVASDTAGNIASEIPGLLPAGGVTLDTWDEDMDTPAFPACGHGQGDPRVYSDRSGAPTCNSDDTANDEVEDIAVYNQNRCTKTYIDTQAELKGFSASVNSNYVFVRLRLGAPITLSNYNFTDAFAAMFLNPDALDPSPDDIHIADGYMLSFAPQTIAIDRRAASYSFYDTILTNMACITQSIMEYNNGERGNAYNEECYSNPPNAASHASDGDGALTWGGNYVFFKMERNLVFGNESESTVLWPSTAGVDLSEFKDWLLDSPPGMRIYARNHEYTI